MKIRRARSLAAKAYETSNTNLASAALAVLKHYRRRDRVAEGLAARIKGDGVPVWVPKDGSGAPATLVLDQANNRGWYGGTLYATEAATLAAVSGSQSGITRTVGNYVAPAAPELQITDLASWVGVNSGLPSVVGGELVLDLNGTTGAAARNGGSVTQQGKAYRARATYRRGTSASSASVGTSRASSLSPLGNVLATNTTTSNVTNERTFGGEGATSYVALRSTAATPTGTVILNDASIKEATAFAGFSTPSFAEIINFHMPSSLPASAKALFSNDDDGARNRYRGALNADGTMTIVLDSNGTNRESFTISAGLLTLGAAHKLHISFDGSTRFLAALNDTYLYGQQGGKTPAGFAWVRVGKSPAAGEEWTGTIENAAFFAQEYVPPRFLWPVGDSYVAGVGGASVEQGIEASDPARLCVSTGDGGSSIATQLANMQANPGLYGCPLIQWDGDANAANATTDPAIFEQMAALAPRHVFISSLRRENHSAPELAATDARNAYLSARFGVQYYNAQAKALTLSDGSPADLAAVAANKVPPSALQADGTHLTATAMAAIMADMLATTVVPLGY